MTRATVHRLSQAGLYIAAGVNVGSMVPAIAARQDAVAAFQLAFAAVLVAVADSTDRLHVWLEAQIAKARTEHDLARAVYEQFQRQGGAEVRVMAPPDVPRWRN